MPVQLLFIALVLLLTILLWRSRETASGRAWKRILLLLFAALVIFAILFPQTTTKVANLLGIGRGADLVVYLTAFSLLYLALLVYLKFRRLDDRLAALTRELALAEWEEGGGAEDRRPNRDA